MWRRKNLFHTLWISRPAPASHDTRGMLSGYRFLDPSLGWEIPTPLYKSLPYMLNVRFSLSPLSLVVPNMHHLQGWGWAIYPPICKMIDLLHTSFSFFRISQLSNQIIPKFSYRSASNHLFFQKRVTIDVYNYLNY